MSSAIQWGKIFLVVLSSVVATDAAFTYNNNDNIQENTAYNHQQAKQISQLQIEVAELGVRNNLELASNFKHQPASCSCIKKDNAGKQEFINCPAKNFTCDEESRNTCEAVYENYEC
ncbi:hypothetical protein K6P01_004565 [Vibrio parahaemolyticus]|uniref:hypothetical protein n=1 Tax=Vibrio parahaemolyticus TaxID=670 RepID=UPI0007A0CD56|nr:hypothetical protein [Vibrio parahaemolyticus]EHK2856267.1 hypothetical protein [Vibrio parahaemolyticus]EHZ7351099.1 hypothetical protein [Vibrio parahaemolyticus]EJG0382203.1 hypothetical protein [Vibrio parahaemolyticus]EJG0403489.1 hypothetical protein [Vibrio parahaemolyticus]EJO2026748.1 hypothetical protein [Vibrio parahaemolyticus]